MRIVFRVKYVANHFVPVWLLGASRVDSSPWEPYESVSLPLAKEPLLLHQYDDPIQEMIRHPVFYILKPAFGGKEEVIT